MSHGDFPHLYGDALMIPRIVHESLLDVPEVDGIGVLVGPGANTGTLSAVVTAKKRGIHHLVDDQLEIASPGLMNFRLSEGQLVAYVVPTPSSGQVRGSDISVEWPPTGSYTVPFATKDGGPLTKVTHIDFDALDVLFSDARRSYSSDQDARNQDIVTSAMHIRNRHHYEAPTQRNLLREYHQVSVLIGAANPGQLAVALVGSIGATNYLLSSMGRRISRRSQSLTVAEGTVYSNNGTRKQRIGKLASRHIEKVEL